MIFKPGFQRLTCQLHDGQLPGLWNKQIGGARRTSFSTSACGLGLPMQGWCHPRPGISQLYHPSCVALNHQTHHPEPLGFCSPGGLVMYFSIHVGRMRPCRCSVWIVPGLEGCWGSAGASWATGVGKVL